jgi:hypothetical protein
MGPMTETPPDVVTYAAVEDVRAVLGKLGDRPGLPDLEVHLAMAHADVVDRLSDVYGPTLPTWRPVAAEAVRWAEAKIAAASVLDILRAALDDASRVAEELRASAYATIAGGLPGQRPGDATPELEEGQSPVPSLPRSSYTVAGTGGLSNFADPYGGAYPVLGEWYA